jgi:hypothetical protein
LKAKTVANFAGFALAGAKKIENFPACQKADFSLRSK